ncbi:PIG-L family deacetylase [Candidatus Woesebacteria bacterium]|nr:PIG-L family deacetylase [Candidatus Woesebacteria bacterium]
MIRHIIAKKIPCYFISPHLDDAIFSAGGLISKLRGKVDITIINVFTSAGVSGHTLSASTYLKQCGESDAQLLFVKRIKEDQVAGQMLGAKVINLGYQDALWRAKSKSNYPIPELNVIYPTYRLHVSKGRISHHDNQLMQDLSAKLRSIIKEPEFYIFAPIGYGKHVDHVLVRDVVTQSFAASRIIYWSDFPYYFRDRSIDSFLSESATKSFSVVPTGDLKLRASRAYATQFSAVVTDLNTIHNPEVYYLRAQVVAKVSHMELLKNHIFGFLNYPKDYLYSYTYPSHSIVSSVPWDSKRAQLASHIIKQLHNLAPIIAPILIGSTPLGIAGAGDIDILVPASLSDFPLISKLIKTLFGKPTHTSQSMIQWKKRGSGTMLELDLIDQNSDRFHNQKNLATILQSNSYLRNKYAQFKASYEGCSYRAYVRGQIQFFDRLVANLDQDGSFPVHLYGYDFVREHKSSHRSAYQFASYKNNQGKEIFVKRWQGNAKNLSYYWLKNEIRSYKIIQSIFDRNRAELSSLSLTTPTYITSFATSRSLYLLIDFVEGKELASFSTKSKLSSIDKALSYFSQITRLASPAEKRQLLHRCGLYFALLLPFITVKAMIYHPAHFIALLKSALSVAWVLPRLIFHKDLVITHRDYNDWCIKLDKSTGRIYDLQLMCLADPVLEHAVIILKKYHDKEFISAYFSSKHFKKSLPTQADRVRLLAYLGIMALYDASLSHSSRLNSLDYLQSGELI